jgi:predicted transcriptional regulator
MGRPSGNQNLVARAKAFEMYASGFKKSAIAEAVGVTKAAVSNWSKRDRWEERLGAAIQTAERSAAFATQDALAATLAELQARLGQRLVELNLLCGPSQEPRVRLQAIAQWIKLAKELEGKVTKPATPGTLSLIDDYAVPDNHTTIPPAAGAPDSTAGAPPTSGDLQVPCEDPAGPPPFLDLNGSRVGSPPDERPILDG